MAVLEDDLRRINAGFSTESKAMAEKSYVPGVIFFIA